MRLPRIRFLSDEPLSPAEQRLALRIAIVFAIPLAMIVCGAMLVAFLLYRGDAQGQIDRNQEAIAQTRALAKQTKALALRQARDRRAADSAVAQAVFDQCVANEHQDAILVAHFQTALDLLANDPPTESRTEAIDLLREQMLALEPPGEPDCQIPRPKARGK